MFSYIHFFFLSFQLSFYLTAYFHCSCSSPIFFTFPFSLTPLCLPMATHSCPAQDAGECSWEQRCTCSSQLLNSRHQSHRCLHQRRGQIMHCTCSWRRSISRQAMLMWDHRSVLCIWTTLCHCKITWNAWSVLCFASVCLARWEQDSKSPEMSENVDLSHLPSKPQWGLLVLKTVWNNRKEPWNTRD